MKAIADSNPATDKDKRFRSTLYELMEALGDVIRPGEERLIAVVVQDLMKSGQLQFLGRKRLGKNTGVNLPGPN